MYSAEYGKCYIPVTNNLNNSYDNLDLVSKAKSGLLESELCLPPSLKYYMGLFISDEQTDLITTSSPVPKLRHRT